MSRSTVSVEELERYLDRAEIIDVRSPGEYTEDFIPGAVNHPILDDAERALVGTLNKQDSPFEAKRRGAALAARNIAAMIEAHFLNKPHDWAPLIYCWRGGKRSGFTTHMLREIGFEARQLLGGYKAYRGRVNADLKELPQRLRFITICGCTGTGKTALLHELAQQGAQVLDLEGLAKHRGSLLGERQEPQPSQKRFDSLLWDALRRFDPARPVFVESESKRIGLVQMPDALRDRMHAGETLWLEVPLAARVAHLREEYAHFVADPLALVAKLEPLRPLRGSEQLAQWQQMAERGAIDELFASLMQAHYDPLYRKAIRNNFSSHKTALTLHLERIEAEDLRATARTALSEQPTQVESATLKNCVQPG